MATNAIKITYCMRCEKFVDAKTYSIYCNRNIVLYESARRDKRFQTARHNKCVCGVPKKNINKDRIYYYN